MYSVFSFSGSLTLKGSRFALKIIHEEVLYIPKRNKTLTGTTEQQKVKLNGYTESLEHSQAR